MQLILISEISYKMFLHAISVILLRDLRSILGRNRREVVTSFVRTHLNIICIINNLEELKEKEYLYKVKIM